MPQHILLGYGEFNQLHFWSGKGDFANHFVFRRGRTKYGFYIVFAIHCHIIKSCSFLIQNFISFYTGIDQRNGVVYCFFVFQCQFRLIGIEAVNAEFRLVWYKLGNVGKDFNILIEVVEFVVITYLRIRNLFVFLDVVFFLIG